MADSTLAELRPQSDHAAQKQNLYELLGRPLRQDGADLGTAYTASPESHDEGGGLDLIAGLGTTATFEQETYDDDMVLMSPADHVGTCESRDEETYDDDTMLMSLADHVGTFVSKSDETYDDDTMLSGF